MLFFETTIKVQHALGESVSINEFIYHKYLVTVGSVKIIALFLQDNLKAGEYITTKQAVLTSIADGNQRIIVFRIEKFCKVSKESVVLPESCKVKCNGRIVKPSVDEIRYVGVLQRPIYLCTLSIRDETGNTFQICLKAFYKRAHTLKAIPRDAFIDCVAFLRPKDVLGEYDLEFRDYRVT